MTELIERLRKMAKSSSEAQRMMAEAKTARQTDRDDGFPGSPGYSWPKPEETYEWQAADALTQQAETIERLISAGELLRHTGCHSSLCSCCKGEQHCDCGFYEAQTAWIAALKDQQP